MRCSILSAAALAALPLACAFPHMTPAGVEQLLAHSAAAEKRGIVDGIGSLTGAAAAAVDPILGLLPGDASVRGLKRFPEDAYPFREPGATDQRGPCPGLNTLANHGYIPRSGIVTIGDIVRGSQQLFNMGADLALLLATGGALDGGDLLTQTMSIGGADARVGVLGGALRGALGPPSGITAHGRFNEGDASATRDDFYLAHGDNYSFRPALFAQLHAAALQHGGGTYSVDAVHAHFANRYAASRAANRQFYFNVPSAAVVMGAYFFIPAFFSNGTHLAGGVPNEGSVAAFYGAAPAAGTAWDDAARTYTRVAERIPAGGWYRRATPLTVADAAAGILDVLATVRPALGGAGDGGNFVAGPVDVPSDAPGLACFLYNAVYANLPSELFGPVRLAQQLLDPLTALLRPGFRALGCPVDFADRSAALSQAEYDQQSRQFVGDAKTECPGSGWYEGASS